MTDLGYDQAMAVRTALMPVAYLLCTTGLLLSVFRHWGNFHEVLMSMVGIAVIVILLNGYPTALTTVADGFKTLREQTTADSAGRRRTHLDANLRRPVPAAELEPGRGEDRNRPLPDVQVDRQDRHLVPRLGSVLGVQRPDRDFAHPHRRPRASVDPRNRDYLPHHLVWHRGMAFGHRSGRYSARQHCDPAFCRGRHRRSHLRRHGRLGRTTSDFPRRSGRARSRRPLSLSGGSHRHCRRPARAVRP